VAILSTSMFPSPFSVEFELIHAISRSIYCILNMLVSAAFYPRFVKLPLMQTPPEIKDNSKLYPFFRNCLGAIDGSHIGAHVPEEDIARYRNRKGVVSQNVLAACSFDMRFTYILSGWEGSAADGLVLSDARETDFHIPDGWYYLADAGFALGPNILTPYRGKRYHLREWGRVSQR
jgi:hypothetical protein